MLFVAFELGWTSWRLAFGSAVGQKAWQVRIPARDVVALSEAIAKARKRLGLPGDCPVFSCYEAGREGFWLHRLLQQMSVVNVIVDSSSIEVNRRARRAKTDRLDAEKLLSMLLRYYAGEKRLWSVVHVPTPEQEDGRHLQRAIRTLKKEQTRSINRIKGLLAGRVSRSRLGEGGCSRLWPRSGSGTARPCLRVCVGVWSQKWPGTRSFIASSWICSPSGMLGSGRERSALHRSRGV
jgi:transposase